MHAGPPPPPVPSAVSHDRSISVRTPPPLSLALTHVLYLATGFMPTTDTVAPPPLSTQGHPNAFPPPTTNRLPPRPPVHPPLPLFLRWHPRRNNADHRRPSRRGLIGPFTYIRSGEKCMHVHDTHTQRRARAFENHRKNKRRCRYSAVAPPPPPPPPPGRRCRVPPSFSSPPGLCRECICDSLLLSRCYVACYVFNTGQLVGK